MLNKFKSPIIIAECGNTHEGSMTIAYDLIDEAKEAGADLVKFQAGTAEGFALHKQDIEFYRKFELGLEGYRKLFAYGKKIGISIFFSIWNREFKEFWKLKYKKIPARQCHNSVIEKYDSETTFISIPSYNTNPVFLGIKKGIPMHTVCEYPAKNPMLQRIEFLRKRLNMDIGYSDHTIGTEACITAVKHFGCVAIEKHFTLNKTASDFRDHQLSATPLELKMMVEMLKNEP